MVGVQRICMPPCAAGVAHSTRQHTSGSFSLRSAIFMRVGYTVPLDLILFEWSALMTRRQKDPLRPLTADEQEWLARIGRSQSDPASHVLRARVLLAVAAG